MHAEEEWREQLRAGMEERDRKGGRLKERGCRERATERRESSRGMVEE